MHNTGQYDFAVNQFFNFRLSSLNNPFSKQTLFMTTRLSVADKSRADGILQAGVIGDEMYTLFCLWCI